ncbi:MAG TPA: RDD family protein [Thermoanaerobaculia bacterium]|nr:RDD family protein [Thermoanaerobaculia bacterium]
MRRSDETPPEEQLLFDLPLEPPARGEAARKPAPRAPREERPEEPSLPYEEPPRAPRRRSATEEARIALLQPVADPPAHEDDTEEERPRLASRLAGGGADLLLHAAVGVASLVGLRFLLGVQPALSDWPAVLLFLLSFSFLYTVVPLAFWGHTLGMAWAGLTSHNRDGEPLTFDQTVRRWMGGLITSGLLGLPLLLTGGGRSLADFLSGSDTYPLSGGESGEDEEK